MKRTVKFLEGRCVAVVYWLSLLTFTCVVTSQGCDPSPFPPDGKESVVVSSYSGGRTFHKGQEVALIGIAVEDTILVDQDTVLVVGGLPSRKTYQCRIGSGEDAISVEKVSDGGGRLVLRKEDFFREGSVAIKADTLVYLFTGNGASQLQVLGQYKKYELWDWRDVQGMRKDLKGDYKLMRDVELPRPGEEGLPREGFDPIAKDSNSMDRRNDHNGDKFTGKFDGRGKWIQHFNINRPGEDYVGLFGYIDASSEVENFQIVMDVAMDSVCGRKSVGAVAGWNQGMIADVSVEGGKVSGDGLFVGGVAGQNNGTIHASTSTGAVSGDINVGGVVGVNTAYITASTSMGDVSGTGNVGGVVGANAAYITASTSTGDVSGTENVGGVVGLSQGSITSSMSTGDVSGTENVGGVAGYNTGVIVSAYSTGRVSGAERVGGIVGHNHVDDGKAGSVSMSYALGQVGPPEGGRIISDVNWLVGGSTGSATVASSYYPYRGEDIEGVSAKDPVATSVGKSAFGRLDRSNTGSRASEPFEGWNFASDGDWKWVIDGGVALWPILRAEVRIITVRDGVEVTIPETSPAFKVSFEAAQIKGQKAALEALGSKWESSK